MKTIHVFENVQGQQKGNQQDVRVKYFNTAGNQKNGMGHAPMRNESHDSGGSGQNAKYLQQFQNNQEKFLQSQQP